MTPAVVTEDLMNNDPKQGHFTNTDNTQTTVCTDTIVQSTIKMTFEAMQNFKKCHPWDFYACKHST